MYRKTIKYAVISVAFLVMHTCFAFGANSLPETEAVSADAFPAGIPVSSKSTVTYDNNPSFPDPVITTSLYSYDSGEKVLRIEGDGVHPFLPLSDYETAAQKELLTVAGEYESVIFSQNQAVLDGLIGRIDLIRSDYDLVYEFEVKDRKLISCKYTEQDYNTAAPLEFISHYLYDDAGNLIEIETENLGEWEGMNDWYNVQTGSLFFEYTDGVLKECWIQSDYGEGAFDGPGLMVYGDDGAVIRAENIRTEPVHVSRVYEYRYTDWGAPSGNKETTVTTYSEYTYETRMEYDESHRLSLYELHTNNLNTEVEYNYE